MPSLSKLVAWCTLLTTAYSAVVQDSNKPNAIDKRDIIISIDTNRDVVAASCDPKDCFLQCADDGAIGGACADPQTCKCAYGPSRRPSVAEQQQHHLHKTGMRIKEESCDKDICQQACYQKGGYVGGLCSADTGDCECIAQSTYALAGTPDDHLEPTYSNGGACRVYNDCMLCFVYERCCFNGWCECGTTGRESICK